MNDLEVTYSRMSFKIFIICHDDESERTAGFYKFGIPLRISNEDPYFEAQVFLKIEELKETWIGCEWVGILTYSSHKRLGFDFINKIPYILEKHSKTNVDLITFFNLNFFKPRVQREVPFCESVSFQMGSSCFLGIYIILKELGYNDDQILDYSMKGFFSNWWICRPRWMEKYITFFKKAKEISQQHPTVKKCLTADGYYAGNVSGSQLTKIFGRPIYEMTPFLFERLPCFFFGLEKANIVQEGINAKWDLLD